MSDNPQPADNGVDSLIEQIRQAARQERALPPRPSSGFGREDGVTDEGGPLAFYLAELERRSHPRTDLPHRFRRFPLTISPVEKLALRFYNLLTREQRAGNVLMRDALQALQAALTRNETALRETAMLTEYVRALFMRRPWWDPARDSTPDAVATAKSEDLNTFFVAFGDEFRGAPELIKERMRIYVPIIQSAMLTGPALDLGCGRGEWLELMREAGVEAIGVEQNPRLIADCRSKGLQALEADFEPMLEHAPAEHWQIVTGFHVIEHLGWPAWYLCLRNIHRALRPGGMMILETPNPGNLFTAANRFYLDPTHRHPLPDALLAFAARNAGFDKVEIVHLHPEDDEAAHAAAPELVRRLTGAQDYAVIARK